MYLFTIDCAVYSTLFLPHPIHKSPLFHSINSTGLAPINFNIQPRELPTNTTPNQYPPHPYHPKTSPIEFPNPISYTTTISNKTMPTPSIPRHTTA
ncbi:hypothetical protein P154DRAFT_356383 [Amniculicola lignicola CBS 123094]|uniref:Uncharacterized protein n=1 Tax=Amniculicola lignicola CBS 123094 TaxID=1392246 RepID=A0A6A5WWY8_9PLEO|nr:hypothetical protein P154DRAFT_356383 [Amniculicola lignicola CBS 123094]